MSWNGEPAGCVWTYHSEILLRGCGHPKATTFLGGPWDMRSPETTAPWSTRGGRVGRPVPWGHRSETGTVKWGVNRSTSRGEIFIRKCVSFPLELLKLNHKSLSVTTRAAMDRPIDLAVSLVALRDKSVARHSLQIVSGPIPSPF